MDIHVLKSVFDLIPAESIRFTKTFVKQINVHNTEFVFICHDNDTNQTGYQIRLLYCPGGRLFVPMKGSKCLVADQRLYPKQINEALLILKHHKFG